MTDGYLGRGNLLIASEGMTEPVQIACARVPFGLVSAMSMGQSVIPGAVRLTSDAVEWSPKRFGRMCHAQSFRLNRSLVRAIDIAQTTRLAGPAGVVTLELADGWCEFGVSDRKAFEAAWFAAESTR